jgi:hypothetical protein
MNFKDIEPDPRRKERLKESRSACFFFLGNMEVMLGLDTSSLAIRSFTDLAERERIGKPVVEPR